MCLDLCLDLSSTLPLCYICLFLYIYLSFSSLLFLSFLFLPVCLSFDVTAEISVASVSSYVSPVGPIPTFICLPVCLFVSLSLYVFVSLCLCPYVSLCLLVSVCLSVSSSLSSLLLASHRIFSIPLPIDPVGKRLVRPWRPQSTSLDRCSCLSSLYRTSDGSEARHLRQQFLLHQRADDGHYPISHIR